MSPPRRCAQVQCRQDPRAGWIHVRCYSLPTKGSYQDTLFNCNHFYDLQQIDTSQYKSHPKEIYACALKGKRPHPDEMAGSDLDGDMYFVLWDTEFFFQRDNYSAMHFPTAEKKELDHRIEEPDMLQHLEAYIKSDKTAV